MAIIGRELVVPFELAGIGIQRQNAIAVEIVALARSGLKSGTGLPVAQYQRVSSRRHSCR